MTTETQCDFDAMCDKAIAGLKSYTTSTEAALRTEMLHDRGYRKLSSQEIFDRLTAGLSERTTTSKEHN